MKKHRMAATLMASRRPAEVPSFAWNLLGEKAKVKCIEKYNEAKAKFEKAIEEEKAARATMEKAGPTKALFVKPGAAALQKMKLIEYMCDDESTLGKELDRRRIPKFRVTLKTADVTTKEGLDKIEDELCNGGPKALWASLQCTDWTCWQDYNMAKLGKRFRRELKARRKISRGILLQWIEYAEANMAQGGMIGFEWPASCRGWQIPELQQLIKRHNLYVVHVDGCMLGVKSTNGDPIKKP